MQATMLALINRERNATLADFGGKPINIENLGGKLIPVFNLVRAIVQTITSIIVAGTGFALVRTDLTPSQAGFILSFAITASRGMSLLLTGCDKADAIGLFTLLERYSSLEQTFVSAERIEHCKRALPRPFGNITTRLTLTDINGPPQESSEGTVPEASWPSKGSIQVEDFSVRYGPDLPDVLHEVSFQVEVGHIRVFSTNVGEVRD
jgi:hypothetical protein